jgi:hypothetical protein
MTTESTKTVKDRPYLFNPPGTDLSKVHLDEVGSAGKELKRFVDPHNVLEGKPNTHMRRPLVTFSFDEAHELTKCKTIENWSIYIELCRSFTYLVELPFFFLFLSTSSKFRDPSLETQWDPSSRRRIANDGRLALPPITETGFDQLAFTAVEGQTTLEEVMTDCWIAHLGRPLYVFCLVPFISGLMAIRVGLVHVIKLVRVTLDQVLCTSPD